MMRAIGTVCGLIAISFHFFACETTAASAVPEFIVSEQEIEIPTDLPGYRPDPEYEIEGRAVYTIEGQVFSDGAGRIEATQEDSGDTGDRSTPWRTLSKLLDAYQRKDWKRIISLYDERARPLIHEMVNSRQRIALYLEKVSRVNEMEILLGYWYEGRFIMNVELPGGMGIQPFFLVQDSGSYRFSAFQDDNARNWNILLYLKFQPEPHATPAVSSVITELGQNETAKLVIGLNAHGNYASLFLGDVRSRVIRSVRDGGVLDLEPEGGVVGIAIPGYIFSPNLISLNVLESNYPLEIVSAEMSVRAARMQLLISPPE